MQHRYVFTFFLTCLTLGVWLNNRSWNGQLFVYVGELRAPAAVRTIEQYSSLERQSLSRTAHHQVMAHAQLFKESDRLGVRLGHPLMSRKEGRRGFGCNVHEQTGAFDRIELTFTGEGTAEAGEPPRMIVNATCRSEHDLNELETVWIPMEEITSSIPENREFDTYASGEEAISIRLQSIPQKWPETWVLTEIRLYRAAHPEEKLTLDSTLLRQAKPKLLSFNWKATAPTAEDAKSNGPAPSYQ